MIGSGLFIALIIAIVGEVNQPEVKTAFLLSSDSGYSNVLTTQYNSLCFGEYGVAALGPTVLREECVKRMYEFTKSPFAVRLVPNLAAQDLVTIQEGIIAATEMQQYCLYFKKDELKSLKPAASYTTLVLVRRDPKVCDWFLGLSGQDREYLNSINTVTYKKITTTENISYNLLHIGSAVFFPLISILALEIIYRLVLFIVFGKEALRLKLK